jgi:hypothetical protein
MKIVIEQSLTVLKIKGKPNCMCWVYFFTLLLNSIFSLSIGLLVLTGGELINLRCNRVEPTQVNCQLMLGETSIPIQGLKGAQKIQTQDRSYYPILLITKSNHIPLGDSISFSESDKDQDKIVAQINKFIGDHNRFTLNIQQDDRFSPGRLVFGLFFTFIGSVGICSLILFPMPCIPYSYIFNKVSDLMYIQSRNLFGRKYREYREIHLSDIQKVRVVEEIQGSEGYKVTYTTKLTKTYTTKLTLRSGEEINLYIQGDANKHCKIARTINDFLNINSLPGV